MKDVRRMRQKSQVVSTMMVFQLVLVLLQLWLFVAVLEDLIAGKTHMAWPGAIASIVILGINVWVLVGLKRLDHGE